MKKATNLLLAIGLISLFVLRTMYVQRPGLGEFISLSFPFLLLAFINWRTRSRRSSDILLLVLTVLLVAFSVSMVLLDIDRQNYINALGILSNNPRAAYSSSFMFMLCSLPVLILGLIAVILSMRGHNKESSKQNTAANDPEMMVSTDMGG